MIGQKSPHDQRSESLLFTFFVVSYSSVDCFSSSFFFGGALAIERARERKIFRCWPPRLVLYHSNCYVGLTPLFPLHSSCSRLYSHLERFSSRRHLLCVRYGLSFARTPWRLFDGSLSLSLSFSLPPPHRWSSYAFVSLDGALSSRALSTQSRAHHPSRKFSVLCTKLTAELFCSWKYLSFRLFERPSRPADEE